MRPLRAVAYAAAAGAGWAGLAHIGRRSGVSGADLRRPMPGDELVTDPQLVIDRAARLPAPPELVWPWLVQVGKGRGGWYLPGWLERTIPASRRPVRTIVPRLQELAPGDEVPDWGPGDPVFRVQRVEPPRTLVQLTLRESWRQGRWPDAEDPLPTGAIALSWATVLEPDGQDATRMIIRVRCASYSRGALLPAFAPLLAGSDYLAFAALFAGLRERVAPLRLT